MSYLSVGECAKRIGARPQDITEFLYKGKLQGDDFPIVGGRRMIPENYVDTIAIALQRAGRQIHQKPSAEVNRG